MQNYMYKRCMIAVPHQRPATAWWTDMDGCSDDFHAVYDCQTVDDLVWLTNPFNADGTQARHQAVRVAALATAALNTLCEWLAEGMESVDLTNG